MIGHSRDWCFTLFENYEEFYDEYDPDMNKINYMIYQLEEGKTKNSPHIQGFIQLKTQKTLKTVKKILGSKSVHLEKRFGTPTEARDYCQKEDTRLKPPKEFGEISYQGKRNDIEEFISSIRNNESNIELIEKHPNEWCKYNNVIDRTRAAICSKSPRKIQVIKDKTLEEIYNTHKHKDIYRIVCDFGEKPTYDGYTDEPVLIIEGIISMTKLKTICDGFPLIISKKYSYTYANWNFVYILK